MIWVRPGRGHAKFDVEGQLPPLRPEIRGPFSRISNASGVFSVPLGFGLQSARQRHKVVAARVGRADAGAGCSGHSGDDDARLASLGYKPQLNRVLGFFSNFAVAFTYLSPMVGIYSLFVLGVGDRRAAYIWLMLIPVVGMLFVALVFGELASHYPVAGALYQYSKFSVGPGYGWFVGWFYGIALLVTVAAVDTGVVAVRHQPHAQLVRHEPRPDQPHDDPARSPSSCWRSRRR